MFVFRIEDADGKGPYSSSNDEAFDIFIYHECPDQMGIDIPNQDYFFSWGTLEKLKEILNPYSKKSLHNSNIWKISVYDVSQRDCIFMPDGQVAFIKENSTLIEKIDFSNLNMIKRYN